MFIVASQYRIAAPSGAAWKQDMPPRWGFFFPVGYYEHGAPNGVGDAAVQESPITELRSRTVLQ